MSGSAPRLDPALLAAVSAFAQRDVHAAEACRLTGALADVLGLTRPSYQTVRVLLADEKRRALNDAPRSPVLVVGPVAGRRRSLLGRLVGQAPALHVTVCYMDRNEPAR